VPKLKEQQRLRIKRRGARVRYSGDANERMMSCGSFSESIRGLACAQGTHAFMLQTKFGASNRGPLSPQESRVQLIG
jgi:hypothetical protein